MATNHEIEQEQDGCDGYRIFRGHAVRSLHRRSAALDPHAWYFEPNDYEGNVAFSAGFATRAEAVTAARNHAVDGR